jgi:hypothetical protein
MAELAPLFRRAEGRMPLVTAAAGRGASAFALRLRSAMVAAHLVFRNSSVQARDPGTK